MKAKICRLCSAPLNHTFCDLGMSPLANSYVSKDNAATSETFYPLHAYVCKHCFLVQLEEYESPDHIFSDYAYFSGFSAGWLKHAELYVAGMVDRFQLGPRSEVVEIASNDGYLLQYFVSRGIPVLGVEPAANVARVARERGVPTTTAFFGEETARRLLDEGRAADLMVANNVLAHVPDILDFVGGFKILMKPMGVTTFEFPHLHRLIEDNQFDTIYHEHFSYLTLAVVTKALERKGLRVFDVARLATHGGSLRVFCCHNRAPYGVTAAVEEILSSERAALLDNIMGYSDFGSNVITIKCQALDYLIRARTEGRLVCGYGAAAKGNTFLNYCGIGPELIRVVADRSPHKQQTLLPGSRIPVVSPEELLSLKPDDVFILPWNLKEEITEELSVIREWGGRFVVAIPQVEIT